MMHGQTNIRLGRPMKRLLDEAETGLSRPNWWRMMIMMILKDGILSLSVLLPDFPQSRHTQFSQSHPPPPLQKCTLLTINVSPLKWFQLASPECVYGDLHNNSPTLIGTLVTYIHTVTESNSALAASKLHGMDIKTNFIKNFIFMFPCIVTLY